MAPAEPIGVLASSRIKPFLRWAGGKRWLARRVANLAPRDYGTYFEPFLGGGAVFFELTPERAIISDLNRDLILAYRWVRRNPNALIASLTSSIYGPDEHLSAKKDRPVDGAERAVRLLYLNRTSWNGLYRVNSKGEFNVPFGGRRPFEEQDALVIRLASAALQKACIHSGDFVKGTSLVNRNDLVFLDPPYTVTHGRNGFILYNERIFSWRDQLRLARRTRELSDRGAFVIMTNANHPSIAKLYRGFKVTRLKRHSILAADPANRSEVSELLITNFDFTRATLRADA